MRTSYTNQLIQFFHILTRVIRKRTNFKTLVKNEIHDFSRSFAKLKHLCQCLFSVARNLGSETRYLHLYMFFNLYSNYTNFSFSNTQATVSICWNEATGNTPTYIDCGESQNIKIVSAFHLPSLSEQTCPNQYIAPVGAGILPINPCVIPINNNITANLIAKQMVHSFKKLFHQN